MDCATSRDRRFPVQRISNENWRVATAANLAADHLAGYDLWTSAFTQTRDDWQEFGGFLRDSGREELEKYVAAHRQESLYFLVMMLTGACNANCPICFTDRRAKRGETTAAQRDAVIHEAAALGARYVYVPGEGEPTIDRDWWPFLESCRSAGLQALVFTNGLIFSDEATSQKYWGCRPEEAVSRLADYPVSLYVKMWSTVPELVGQMMGIDPGKYLFTGYDGITVPVGMINLLEGFSLDRLGIEVVVERRNADEVVELIVPFAERHGLSQIVEMIQHNGRTMGNASYDPSPDQVAAVQSLLSPTSCSVATCKAVVTSRGYLSPRIAILENQLPTNARRVEDGSLWDLLHSSDYLVQRRYESACLCETEPVSQAQARGPMAGPSSIIPPSLLLGQEVPSPRGASEAPASRLAGRFGADASVGQLAGTGASHGATVKVRGRVKTAGPGLFELSDGPDMITVSGADAPAWSWVAVYGTWDAVACALRAEELEVLKEPQRQPFSLIPEAAAIKDPRRLLAVLDRTRLVTATRGFLAERGYLEVTTPMLASAAEMCHVNQAITEPILGRRFYLRTDPEEYIKRYLSAGLEAVFEISTNVRADEPDERHLMEFQSLEYYRRLMDFDGAISLADELIRDIVAEIGGGRAAWEGQKLATAQPFPRITYAELFSTCTGVDIASEETATADGLQAALEKAGCHTHVDGALARWRRAWLDEAADRYVLPQLRQPMWVTHFPAELGLSARLDPADDRFALRAELYLPGGLELAHVYENLVDGEQLRARYDARRSHRVAAGLSHVPTNEGLMASAEVGMPPMAGGAIGIDRVLLVARAAAGTAQAPAAEAPAAAVHVGDRQPGPAVTPVRVWLIDSADVAGVLRQGGAHPVLGGLLDIGTSATLRPDTADARSPADIIETFCAQLNEEVLVIRVQGLHTRRLRDELEMAALASPVFAVIFPAADSGESPLVAAAGPALPAMGFIDECDVATFEASVWFALGKADMAPATLFTEPPSGADQREDERLDERLRQLYGE
jgi:elongation factor P--beta-lysine ligase